MSQIIAMAKRLQDAELMVADLRRALEGKGTSSSNGRTAVPLSVSPDSSLDVKVVPEMAGPQRRRASQAIVRSPSREPTSEEMLSDLSLDSNGRVSVPVSSTCITGLGQSLVVPCLTYTPALLLRADLSCP